MKKLIFIVAILIALCDTLSAQNIRLKLHNDSTNVNLADEPINKGDEFLVTVKADGNNNTTARSLYFDFEFQNTSFDFVSVNHTGTGGNGGILPAGSTITMDYYLYPGYSWVSTQQNTTSNGNANYEFANYQYTEGGPKTIMRVYLNWASSSGLPYSGGWDDLLVIRFRLKQNAVGFVWDPIKMNFAAAYNQNGSAGTTEMTVPLTSVILLDPTATSYVNARIDLNGNMSTLGGVKISFVDPVKNINYLFDVVSNGKVNVIQSALEPNTTYYVQAMVSIDKLKELYDASSTVSDYTTAQAEYVSQNLDGSFRGQSIVTGAGYLAADINQSRNFDGGDLTRLFAATVGLDSLAKTPADYTAGSNGWISTYTFTDSVYNRLTAANWKAIGQEAFVEFRTGAIGTNKPLNLRYMLLGDINRSHSSQVVVNGAIVSNALPALRKNLASNTQVKMVSGQVSNINVTISNQTVKTGTIDIPVSVNTNGQKLSALQFEFQYDPTKVKFEQLINNMPNTWYVFVNNKTGVIKFGALDKDLKTPVTGTLVPFKLRFSAVSNPLDLNTMIRISLVMDAASSTGAQLGIILNSDVIKLTGYNNF